MKKTLVIGLIIVVVSVLIDQISKICMLTLLVKEHNFIEIIPNFFSLKLQYNPNIAFSIDMSFEFQMLFTIVATTVFAVMALSSDFKTKKFYSWGIFLMIGGMIGNFFDRIFNQLVYGGERGVIDFLSFKFFGNPFATFNIADSCLVIGVICVFIDLLFLEDKRNKQLENTITD